MEFNKFCQHIDQLAEAWTVDANDIVKGTYKKNGVSSGPGRRVNRYGEAIDANTTANRVQVIAWRPREEFCRICSKFTENRSELIDLERGQIKCGCGLKYPIINITTVEADK